MQPRWVEFASHTDRMTSQVDKQLLEEGVAEVGTWWSSLRSPPGQAGTTNMVKVHKIGDLPDGGANIDALRRGDADVMLSS